MIRRLATCVTLLVAMAATAHHSPARFQRDQIVAIYGEVTEVDWRNPHVYISLRDGDDVEWLLETNATTNLQRAGWRRDSVVAGDMVTARAYANVDPDKTHVMLVSVTRHDGGVLQPTLPEVSGNPNDASVTASDISGVWMGDPRRAFQFLFAAIDHPVTEEAAIARAGFEEAMEPSSHCVLWPTPRIVAWSAFYPVELTVTEDAILFLSEYGKAERTIHTDGRSFPDTLEPTNQGYSIGHWEDDTLVVETRFLAESISPIAAGTPSGPDRQVFERYTVNDDGKSMRVEIEVIDPDYLVGSFKAELLWFYTPELPFVPFDCNPEVASRFAQ